MLQEMKHRIKNSIAKMLAIARQTAANSNSLQDFTSSFWPGCRRWPRPRTC